METETLILDWEEERATLTPPQSDKGDQANGALLNNIQADLPMVRDLAARAFVHKLEGVRDTVLDSYHRIYCDGFLEGWMQAMAMSVTAIPPDTIAPSVASTASDTPATCSVMSPAQPATVIPDLTDTLGVAETPINTPIVATEPEHTGIDTTMAPKEPELVFLDNAYVMDIINTHLNKTNKPEVLFSIDTTVDNADKLIDLTPPSTRRPFYAQPLSHDFRPPPFLPPNRTYSILQRPYIPTTTLYGIPPPCDITPILPSLSPTPTPPYPNISRPSSYTTPPAPTTTTPPAPTTTTTISLTPSCLLTSHTTTSPAPSSTPLPSLLLGPIPPAALIDWDAEEPHAYFAEKLGCSPFHVNIMFQGSEYVDEVDTGERYMRLTFWEARAAERALGVFRRGYSCGGGVVWGWVWRS